MKKMVTKMLKKMKWYDVPRFKLVMFFATLFLITVWPGFHNLVMRFAWYWYLILTVILAIPLWKKMF
ncbi:hypothetical protein ISS08_00845 [Candidatus Pacearchaeota archaeon]|nr:hypothetical protein [Candidatus Pacearchaeota archaeon]